MSDTERGGNPFGALMKSEARGAAEIAEAGRAMQEVQAAIVMAKKAPRDPLIAAEAALAECKRVTLARGAIYTYPRGGTNVEGPSIRLAEAICRAWGNMQWGILELSRMGDESTMLAYSWDLQTNTMARREFKVRHIRDTKQGGKPVTDERDIYEVTANAGARRLRACMLQLIPGDVIEACVERCKLTIEQSLGRIEQAVPTMVEKFGALGVTPEMIQKRLHKVLEAITYTDLVNLGNIYTSIEDGMGTVADYFEVEGNGNTQATGSRVDAARAAAAKAAGKNPTNDLVAAKAIVKKYIDNRVPEPDRPWAEEQLNASTTYSQVNAIYGSLQDQYGPAE